MLRCVQGAELPVHRWAELHPVCTAPVSSAPPWSCVPRARHKASGAPRQCQPCCASTWLWAPVSATRAMRLCDSHSAVGSAGGCGEQQGVEAAGSRQGCGPWAARGLGAGTWLLAGGTQPASSVLTLCTSVHAVLLTLALLSAAPGFPRAVSAAVLPVPVPRSGPRAPPIGALLSPGARCVCQAQALLPSTCASQPPLLRTPCLLSVELPTTNHCPCCTVLLCEQLPLLWSPITPTQHPTPHPSPALLASQIPNSWRWERTRPSGRDVLAAPTLGSPVLCALPTRAPGSVPLDVCTCSRPPQHTRCLSAPRLPPAPGPRGPGQRLHGSARMAVSSLPLPPCAHTSLALPGGLPLLVVVLLLPLGADGRLSPLPPFSLMLAAAHRAPMHCHPSSAHRGFGLAVSSCSRSRCSRSVSVPRSAQGPRVPRSLSAGTRSWGGEGFTAGHASLLWMSPSSCGSCSRAHPGLQLALTAPLTRAHPGLTACSVLAHSWLTLKSSPHVVVAAAAAPDSSSRSGAGQGRQADRQTGTALAAAGFPAGSVVQLQRCPRAPHAGSPSQARSLCAPRAAPMRPELRLAPASSSSCSPPVLSSPPLCSGPCHCRGGPRGGPLAGGGARPSPLPPAAPSGCAHPASRVRVLSITCQTLYSFNICRYVPLFPTFHQQKGLSNSFQIRRSRWLHGTSVPILSLFIASPGPDKGWALGLI